MKVDKIIEFLPETLRKVPAPDNKFLFFFTPVNLDEKFLFKLPLKVGVQIFSFITLIQAISSFLDIFSPGSFRLFIVTILRFLIYSSISLYAFLATMKDNYSYAKVSYIFISIFFLLETVKYLCKCVIKVIDFITPWDKDFLRLEFLVYIFGYGVFLFIYLYFIYILYRYMIQLGNQNQSGNSNPQNNDGEDERLNEEDKINI